MRICYFDYSKSTTECSFYYIIVIITDMFAKNIKNLRKEITRNNGQKPLRNNLRKVINYERHVVPFQINFKGIIIMSSLENLALNIVGIM